MNCLYLTAREYAALLEQQNGKRCVRSRHETRELIAEHSTPNAFKLARLDRFMRRTRYKIETRRDAKAIAKAKRPCGRPPNQYERRKKYGPQLPGRPSRSGR